jgi:hypothetical protein
MQVLDGYFVHFVAPENLPPMSKHVVFILDTSGLAFLDTFIDINHETIMKTTY